MSEKNKHLPKVLIIAAVFLIVIIYFTMKKNSFRSELAKTAYAVNQTCPVMVDRDTRLDSAIVIGENTLQYHYTLVNLIKDSMDVDLLQLSFEPAMIDNARQNPDLQPFRDNNIILSYAFRDKDKEFMMKIDVSPDKYR